MQQQDFFFHPVFHHLFKSIILLENYLDPLIFPPLPSYPPMATILPPRNGWMYLSCSISMNSCLSKAHIVILPWSSWMEF